MYDFIKTQSCKTAIFFPNTNTKNHNAYATHLFYYIRYTSRRRQRRDGTDTEQKIRTIQTEYPTQQQQHSCQQWLVQPTNKKRRNEMFSNVFQCLSVVSGALLATFFCPNACVFVRMQTNAFAYRAVPCAAANISTKVSLYPHHTHLHLKAVERRRIQTHTHEHS